MPDYRLLIFPAAGDRIRNAYNVIVRKGARSVRAEDADDVMIARRIVMKRPTPEPGEITAIIGERGLAPGLGAAEVVEVLKNAGEELPLILIDRRVRPADQKGCST
jgi:hypothetical protein